MVGFGARLHQVKIRCIVVLLLAACASIPTPRRDIDGVSVGTSRDGAHAKLGANGTMLREERRRQEVWELRDARFASAIVGYDEEWKVRFITAIAKEKIRYADVLDIKAAEHRSAGRNHTYVWRPSPHADYEVRARGTDPEVLTYLTLRRVGEEKASEEEDD
jgi:hypothetical protein